jgi:hypothetical protein
VNTGKKMHSLTDRSGWCRANTEASKNLFGRSGTGPEASGQWHSAMAGARVGAAGNG